MHRRTSTATALIGCTLLSACAVTFGSRGTSASTSTTAATVGTSGARAADGAVTVFLVRHAEKAAAPADDPPLTPDGTARAAALAATLRDARLDAVFTTQLRRTQDTARPAAQAGGLPLRVVGVGRDAASHAAAVADSVRALAPGSTALVVGHSNTIPAIVTALGGPTLADLCDAEYDAVFVVAIRPGRASTVAKARYGAPSVVAGCASMR